MTGHRITEEETLDLLRAHASVVNGPSPLFLQVAKAAFEMREIDADLAELLSDSALVGAGQRSDVRASADERTVLYSLAEGTLRLHLAHGSVNGQVQVDGVSAVHFKTARAEVPLTLDSTSSFVVSEVGQVPFSFLVRLDGGHLYSTDWLVA